MLWWKNLSSKTAANALSPDGVFVTNWWSGDQRYQRFVERHNRYVAVALGRQLEYAAVKDVEQAFDKTLVTLIAAPPVGHKYAVGREGVAAVLEERFFHQSIDNLFAVKTIYQNYIGIVAEHFNIFRAIRLDNFKMFAFVRQFEQAARHGDDLRIDVHGGLLGIGQVAVYPTGKRAAAQADLGDVFGRSFCKQ